MAKLWLANTLPAPATWVSTPSKTRRPCASSFMPSSRKCRKNRPACDTPKASAWSAPGASLGPPSAIIGLGRPVAIGVLIAQERDEVAGLSKASAEHRGPGRLVPDVVNLIRRKMSAGWEQSDRLPVHKLPRPRRDFGTTVALAIAHR